MKKLILSLSILVSGFLGSAQTSSLGLNTADVKVIQSHFSQSINLCLPSGEKANSIAEANALIASFYNGASVNNFTVLHRGASKGENSQYFVATFDKNGETYRLYALYENPTNPKIKTLRISK